MGDHSEAGMVPDLHSPPAMTRFSAVLFLIGTTVQFTMAFDLKSEQRKELRAALERYVAKYPGFTPDLRSTAPSIADQLRRIDNWRTHNPYPATGRQSGACPGYVISAEPAGLHWHAAEK